MNVKSQKCTEDIKKRCVCVLSEIHSLIIQFSFDETKKLIADNGGRVVGLEEPKLTHIIIDRRDDSRRLELMKRTSKSVC